MLPTTHALSGWCLGNLIKLNSRERLFCMIAACISDLDGIGLIFDMKYYLQYHHIVGHNIYFGIICSLILAFFSQSKLKSFFTYLSLFHVHLILDYYGSGTGWGIYYLWPFSNHWFHSPHAWPFYSWQNQTAGVFFIVWMIIITFYCKRTPLEMILPPFEKRFIAIIERIKFSK